MRILHVIPYYAPSFVYGGPVVVAQALANAQAAAGHDVRVSTTNRNGDVRLSASEQQSNSKFGVHVTYHDVLVHNQFAYSNEMANAMRSDVEAADIVHVHGLYTHSTWLACRSASASGIPYVITPHGMLDPYSIERKGSFKKKLYLRLVEQRHIDNAAAVHCTTDQELELARSVVRISNGTVVANPVPVDHLPFSQVRTMARSMFPAIGPDPYMLFMGRVDPKKGLELAIDALARLPMPRPTLVIAGTGEAQYIEALKQRAIRAGVEPQLKFVGFVRDREQAALLVDASFFLLTSYSENFGLAVVEAMAAQTPVLVSERVNLASAVASAGAGLAPPCDCDAIAACFQKLLSLTPDERIGMGKAGADWARENTSPEIISAKFIELYSSLIS